MSPRSAFMQLVTKAAIGIGALFLVGVMLAAIPNHRPPVMAETPADSSAYARQDQQQGQAMDHGKTPGMSMEMDDSKSAEPAATQRLKPAVPPPQINPLQNPDKNHLLAR